MQAEDKLILASVKIQPGVAELEQLNDLIPQIRDWDYVVKTSIDRGIGPLLSKKLPLLRNNPQIPAHVKTKLQQAYYKTFSRSALLYEYFKKVAEALALHNIEVIALKGIYLSEWLYEDIGLRQFSDMDLLVREEDGPQCLAILAGMGFRPCDSSVSEFIGAHAEVVHYTPMVRNDVSVEIHIKLHRKDKNYCINIHEFIENAVPVTLNDVQVKALCLPDLMIHLCVHVDKHFRGGHVQFTSFNDIVNLLDKYRDEIKWPEFIKATRYHKCEEVVFKYLLLVNKYFQAPLPVLVQKCYPHLLTEEDEELFYNYLKGHVLTKYHVTTHWQNMSEIGSLGNKARYFAELIFPPKKFMLEKYGIRHPSLFMFYYPYRYWVGVKGIFKIMVND